MNLNVISNLFFGRLIYINIIEREWIIILRKKSQNCEPWTRQLRNKLNRISALVERELNFNEGICNALVGQSKSLDWSSLNEFDIVCINWYIMYHNYEYTSYFHLKIISHISGIKCEAQHSNSSISSTGCFSNRNKFLLDIFTSVLITKLAIYSMFNNLL